MRLTSLHADARRRAAPWLALLAIPALGALLLATGGAFRSWAVPALLAGTLLWAAFAAGADATAPCGRALQIALWLALIAEALLVAKNPHIIYPHRRSALRANVLEHALEAFCVLSLLLAPLLSLRPLPKARSAWFWGSLAFLLAARIAVLAISPKPRIDVFTSGTLGAEHFWHGRNPYLQTYPDIYKGKYGYAATFFYAPVYLVWSSLAYVLGDIRWATILAEAIGAAAVLSFARAHQSREDAKLLLVVWLTFPVYLFMVEQAWVDPIVLATVAWGVRALSLRRFGWAGFALGVGLGVKQTVLLLLVMAFAWVLRTAGKRPALRFLGCAALAAGASYGPYLIWDARAITHSLVTNVTGAPNRMDALTLNAWFHHLQWPDVSRSLRWIALAVCAAACLWLWRRAARLSDLTSLAVLAYLVVFLCGYQAFCNYYWFVGGLLFLDLLVRGLAQPEAEESLARPS